MTRSVVAVVLAELPAVVPTRSVAAREAPIPSAAAERAPEAQRAEVPILLVVLPTRSADFRSLEAACYSIVMVARFSAAS